MNLLNTYPSMVFLVTISVLIMSLSQAQDDLVEPRLYPFAQDESGGEGIGIKVPNALARYNHHHPSGVPYPSVYRNRNLQAAMVCNAMNCPAPRACIAVGTAAAVCQCPNGFIFDGAMSCNPPSATFYIVLHFVNIQFIREFLQPASPQFRTMQSQFISYIYLILVTEIQTSGVLLDIYIIRFLDGSLIVEAQIMFKEGANITEAQLRDVLERGMKNTPMHASLNITNAQIDNIYQGDVCEDVHMCGPNAYCVSENKVFKECRCREGYENVAADSNDKSAFQCELICPPEECSNRGFCEYNPLGEKQCHCYLWHLGRRCQYNGITILLTLIGSIGFLVLIAVSALIWNARSNSSMSANGWTPFRDYARYMWPFTANSVQAKEQDKDAFSIKSNSQ